MGSYNQPGSERASRRFRTYFGSYDNGGDEIDQGRYYAVQYGPVTLIAIDVTNGPPNGSELDTNFMLLGHGEPGGGGSPGFVPDSRQYEWLEGQLAEAQQHSAFTFVFFHHVPYSVGPHGWPAGDPSTSDGVDSQSGVPVRSLTPLFMRYGVDALIAGHDEIWERSEIEGRQLLADGTERPHRLQVFDVGIAGDGLRAPEPGLTNPYQKFLVHSDVPEVWVDGILQSGGKHYGHLEVDVLRTAAGGWQAVMKPVYAFPLLDSQGVLQSVERRLYDDIVTLTDGRATAVLASTQSSVPEKTGFEQPFPNPFNSTVLLRFALPTAEDVRVMVYDMAGQRLRRLLHSSRPAGHHAVEWDGRDGQGDPVASGVYLFRLEAGSLVDTVEAALVR